MLFQSILERIIPELNRQKISYMLIGGQAVLVHGEPRFTKDIDITLGVGTDDVERILDLVKRLGFTPSKDSPIEFAKRTMILPVVDSETGISVDLAFSLSEYERQAIARAALIKFGKITVRVISLEDLIIHKTIAGRPRDIADLETLLLKNPGYDKSYVLKWLKQFDEGLELNSVQTLDDVLRSLK